MTRDALVLGCGRSGTSIFGELFEHLPGFTYLSEPPFADLARSEHAGPLAVKVPKESTDHPATPGLSFPLAALPAILRPGWKTYWIVRHPLDAVASLRPGIANGWGHHPRPADWQEWLDRPLVERCAHHWADINERGYARVREIAEVVRFESMVRDPLGFAARIWAGVAERGEALPPGARAWAARVHDTDNEHFVEARTSRGYSRADHSRRIGRWRENLDAREVAAAVPIVQRAAHAFGYELPAPGDGRA